jgi:hypothetical protein
MGENDFELATPSTKKYKLFFWGPEGSFKTRTALRLGNVPDGKQPSLAIIDTESGSEHYSGEFNFLRIVTVNPDKVYNAVKNLVRNPGNVKTLVIDSFTIYYQSLISKYVDLFMLREITSKGNKGEYYVLQPRDYQAINREAYNLVRMLIASDLNIIVTAHAKDKWGENMQIEGLTPDAPKKMSHFFDTVIEIETGVDGKFHGYVRSKDRTNKIAVNESIPWHSDIAAVEYIQKAFGHLLSETPESEAVNIDIPIGPDFGVEKVIASDIIPEDPEEILTKAEPTKPKPVKAEATKAKPKEEVKAKPETKKADLAKAATKGSEEERTKYMQKIAKLKAKAKIVDRDQWLKVLEPYKVETANHMSPDQMEDLIGKLKEFRPT